MLKEAVLYQKNSVQKIRTNFKTFCFPITPLLQQLTFLPFAFPAITKTSYIFFVAGLPLWPHNRIMNNFYKFTKTNHMAQLKVC